MNKKKNLREHGKIRLSRYFQKFKKGDQVAVIKELAVQPKFPKKVHGRAGTVEGQRGDSYLVKIKDLKKEKTYIIHPVHLIKIK